MTGFDLNEEQALAASTLSGPLSIAAGAGSGKTRVLAERFCNAVIPGRVVDWDAADVTELLAITFTDKAAGELAERVRRTLRESNEHQLATRVDAAWISTIHGMCAKILRTSALEAGLDPSFRVLDTVEAGRFREQAFEEAARAALADGGEMGGLFAQYGFEQIAESVQALAAVTTRTGIHATDMEHEVGLSARVLCQEALTAFRGAAASLDACDGPGHVVSEHLSTCSTTVRRLEALCAAELDDDELAASLWRLLTSHEVPRSSKGVKDIKDELSLRTQQLLAAVVATLTSSYCAEIKELTVAYSSRLRELKQAAGVLDFDDLQRVALELFARRPDVADRWRREFRAVMVDEFQDTDEQQLRIISAIAGDDLCTVGDALQSIYRFRGANVDVYRAHNSRMESVAATSVALATNYRSHPRILEFVNHVFGQVLPDDLVRLKAGRDEPSPPFIASDVRVELLVSPPIGRKSGPSRTALAERIASRVKNLTDEGVRLGDIVVLLRSYNHAEHYAEALRSQGMDAVVVGGNRFLSRPEVGVMRCLCRLLGNRQDEEVLGVVLASPLGGISDDGLLALRRAADSQGHRSLWTAFTDAPLSPADSMRRDLLLEALGEADAALGVRPLGECLLRVFERTGWDLVCLAQRTAGLQTYATVLKLAGMADSFGLKGAAGPSEFAEYLDAKSRYGDHEAPAAVVGEGSDAVRLMSIHASKGLEFPVVIVPELDGGGRADTTIARWTTNPEPMMAMRLPTAWGGKVRRGSWFERIKELEDRAEAEEYLRLFYVAFTRARELLILAGAGVSATSDSMLRTVLTAVDAEAAESRFVEDEHFGRLWLEVVPPADEDEAADEVPSTDSSDDQVLEFVRLLREEVGPTPAPGIPPTRLSYTALSSYRSCPRRFHAKYLLGLADERDGGGSQVSPADFGSAVHAALQAGIKASDHERLAAIASHHRLGDALRRRLADVLAQYLSSDVARLVDEWGGTERREVPFAVRLGSGGAAGFILDGSIDLYAKRGRSALIVDYKTGSSGTQDELGERYGLQARCYALVALRDSAEEVRVVFVRPEVSEADGRLQRVEFTFGAGDAEGIEMELIGKYADLAAGHYGARETKDERVCRACPVPSGCPAADVGQSGR